MGGVMSPRIAVIVRDADGTAKLPQSVTINSVVREVWSRSHVADIGGYPAREYRSGDNQTLFVIQRIAQRTLGDGRVVLLVIVWTPADSRATWRAIYGDILDAIGVDVVAHWACAETDITITVDGVQITTRYLTSPALEAAGGAVATQVKAAWPDAWRAYATGDLPNAPTGVRTIGAVLS